MLIRRAARWSRVALVLAVTLWPANWIVAQVAPEHGPFFLLVIAGFFISTLPNRKRLSG